MKQRLFFILSLGLITVLVGACSPQAVEEVSEPSEALVETSEEETQGVLRPVEEEVEEVTEAYPEPESVVEAAPEREVAEGYPEPDSESVVEEETAEEIVDAGEEETDSVVDGSLPKLPSLAQASTGSSAPPVSGGGGAVGAAESLPAATDIMGTSILVDPGAMFENTEFVIDASYPSNPGTAQVIERIQQQMTADNAIQLATENRFNLPIYQQQVPLDMIDSAQMNEDGTFRNFPFIAFSDSRQITLMDGSYWVDGLVGSAAETVQEMQGDVAYPSDVLLTMAESKVAEMNLGIDYVVKVEGFGNVSIFPVVNGLTANQPIMGIFYSADENGEVIERYSYMDLYGEATVVGDYPLISAEAAWENLKPGLADGSVYWYIDNLIDLPGPSFDEEVEVDAPSYWIPEKSSEGVTTLYGYPTLYNPVADDSPSLIWINGVWAEAPIDVAMMLSTNLQGTARLTGTYVSNEDSVVEFVAQSATIIPFDDQIFLQGTIAVEGDQVYLDSVANGRLVLNAPPADLADGTQVFLNGFLNGVADDGTTQLDWDYISEFVEDGTTLGVSESLPVDLPSFGSDDYAKITINTIELGYGIAWPRIDGEMMIEMGALQSNYLIPIWTFSGVSAEGTEIRFEIPAVDPAYFSVDPT